jgi:hypothetical protein
MGSRGTAVVDEHMSKTLPTPFAFRLALLLVVPLVPAATADAAYPPPREGTWVVRDFVFTTGETMLELRLTTVPSVSRAATPPASSATRC